ncbi:YqcC family protein [Vibrio sp. RC27]
MTRIVPLISLLDQLEMKLNGLNLWQTTPPNEEALSSLVPFAMDTLAPEQWLQWIFIPKMRHALNENNLPRGFSIEPYFAQVWQGKPAYSSLLNIIQQIDKVCQ